MKTVLVATAALAVLGSQCAAAVADPEVGGNEEGGNFFLQNINRAGGAGRENTQAPQVGAGEVTYQYMPVCNRGDGLVGDGFYGCGGQLTCDNGNGYMVNVFATTPGSEGPTPSGMQCVSQQEVATAIAPQITAPMVARAFRRIPLPASALSIQPPGGETLVNLDTVFSTEAEPFRRTLTLLGQQVELDITPATFTWQHGDGSTQTTEEPGRPYERGLPMSAYVTHQYGALAVGLAPRVDTVWTARFRVNGGPWRDVGETVTIQGPPSTLAVREAEPNLVGS